MLSRLRSSFLLSIFISIISAAFTALVDLKASEVQPAALLIVIFTCILGFLRPRRAWLFALINGGSILAAHLISIRLGYNPSSHIEPNIYATLLALIPAFIGAYIGAAAGFVMDSQTKSTAQ